MGGVCASCMAPPEPEFNPDGSKKELQTKAQLSQDAPDLRRAAKLCDLEQMLILLERMPVAQINSGTGKTESTSDELGMTALHYSAGANHLRGCKRLLLYGANVNSRDAFGRSPLHVNLENGRSKVASFLLDQGANRNMQDKNGCCPCMSVLLSGNKGAVNWFLDKTDQASPCVNLTLVDKDGNTCILVAAMYGWWDVVDRMLNMMQTPPSTLEGADAWDFKYRAAKALNTRNKQGDTLLGWVLKFILSGGLPLESAIPFIKHLLSVGVDASTPCFKENCTPLSLAAAIGHRELFDIILEASGPSTLSEKDGLKRTALHFAAAKGHLDLVKFLIESGLRVDKRDANKDTPLHLAAMRGHEEVCNELLAAAAALKKEDPKSEMEPIEMVLLQPNAQGSAVLHMALKAGPTPQAQAAALGCLRHLKPAQVQAAYMHMRKKIAGVTVVEKEKIAETPLLLAVSSHAHAVVKHLLEEPMSVSVDECNARGETAMIRCLSGVTRETASLDATIFRLLMDAGATITPDSANGSDHPLLALCKNDCNAFAAMALRTLSGRCEGAMLDWCVQDSATRRMPLHEAALHNNVHIVSCVLDNTGKDLVESKCNAGITPLAYAAWGCSIDCMKVLLNRGASPMALDSSGQAVLSYCMRLDKPESLECAALLLRGGAEPIDIVDVAGEGLLHRAVRYGASDFIRLWFRCGGDMGIKCSTNDENDACDVPTCTSMDPVLKMMDTKAHAGKLGDEDLDFIDEEVEALEVDLGDEDEATDDEELEAPNAGLAPLKARDTPGVDRRSGLSNSQSSRLGPNSTPSAFASAHLEAEEASSSPRFQPGSPALMSAKRSMCEPTLEGDEGASVEGEEHKSKEKSGEFNEQPLSRLSSSLASTDGAAQIGLPAPPLSVSGTQAGASKQKHKSSKGPVAEAYEDHELIDWWPEDESLGGTGRRAPSFYKGPSIQQRREWKLQGTQWWDKWFVVDNHFFGKDWEESYTDNENGEDFDLEMKDGLLTLDDLLFEIIERQKCGKSNEPGAICEGLMRSASSQDGTNVMQSMKEQRDKERALSPAGSGSPKLGKLTSFKSAGSSSGAESLYGGKEVSSSPSFKDKWKDKTPKAGKLFKSFKEAGSGVGEKLVFPSYDKNPELDALEEHNTEKACQLVSELFAKMYAKDKVDIGDDSFYKPESPYCGEPACMKADVSEMIGDRIQDLLESMNKRVSDHLQELKDEAPQQGPELRARNIECWINSLSPEEYPLKLGAWKQLPKLRRRAVAKARERGTNSTVSRKGGLFNKKSNSNRSSDLPTRPKHEMNTALTYAVRLCRPSCVRALLDTMQGTFSGLIDAEDLFGHTALEYALFQLAKDRHNARMQAIADMLLVQRPFVKEGSFASHNPMQPLIMAVIAYDLPRIAWLVRKCAAPVQASWIFGPDIPTYFCSQWETQLAPLNGAFGPVHIAVLHQRLDVCKLLLELGSSPNEHAWGVNTRSKNSPLAQRQIFLKSLRKGRKEGRPDEDAIMARKQAQLLVQAKAVEFLRFQKHTTQLFIEKQQDIGRQYAEGNDRGGFVGGAHKLMAGATTALLGLATKLRDLVAKLMHGPDVWVSPLHMAARFGADDVCLLLLSRGAAVNGGKAALLARRSPVEEALIFAKANFRYDNRSAMKHNWEAIRLRAEAKIPDMGLMAKAKQAKGTIVMIYDALQGDVIKPAIMAAQVVISMIMNSLKRQVAHYDPALRSAHVLLRHSAPLKLDDGVTNGVVKDLMDNGTWAWLGGSAADINDAKWLSEAEKMLSEVAEDTNLSEVGEADDPNEYRKGVKMYMDMVEVRYYERGARQYMDIIQQENQDSIPHLSSKYNALSMRAYEVYNAARLDRDIVKTAKMLQGVEYQCRILSEVRTKQQAGGQHSKFMETPVDDDQALGMAGFNLEDHAEFLGGAYGSLTPGGLLGSKGAGSMRSASLKMTQSFASKRNMASNSSHFVVPMTMDELRHSEHPLGSCCAAAARKALPDNPVFLQDLQKQASSEGLHATLKKKLQKAQDDYKNAASRPLDCLEIEMEFPSSNFLKLAQETNKESIRAMEDEVAIDSLARIAAGAEFKMFIKKLADVIKSVAPMLSDVCEGV